MLRSRSERASASPKVPKAQPREAGFFRRKRALRAPLPQEASELRSEKRSFSSESEAFAASSLLLARTSVKERVASGELLRSSQLRRSCSHKTTRKTNVLRRNAQHFRGASLRYNTIVSASEACAAERSSAPSLLGARTRVKELERSESELTASAASF